jgi:pimeloyl-ACP methyl ester carboxylesterase
MNEMIGRQVEDDARERGRLPMDEVTSKDGTTISFDRSGGGPPIVLVGGALSDRSAAAPLTAHLAPHFTVYAYDRRGRGDSGDTEPYAVDREIEDMEALILEAGGSAFVLGHSSGAVLALEAARTHPSSITKLALYEPPFIVDDSRPALPEDYVTRLTELVSAGRRGDAVEFFMVSGPGMSAEAVAEMRNAPFWAAMEAVAHTLAYDVTIMGDTMSGSPAPLERWSSVTVPSLVMDGGASPPWQRHAVQALAETLPRAQHKTLEGQDHGPDSEILSSVLKEFFVG